VVLAQEIENRSDAPPTLRGQRSFFWPGSERLRDNRRMTDAAHNQHSKTRRPSDCDRIVTTGPSRFQPARPEVLPEMMSVSVAGIPKNRCRTTTAERMVETRAELPFIGDQIICLSHDHATRSATRQKMG
jgi:hypothetical protein